MNTSLSKSLYTKGLQCPKALWLKKYKKDVLTPPDAKLKAIFEVGNVVGGLACNLFPGGKEIPYEGTSITEKIALTQQWLNNGVSNIFEATFKFDDVLVMVDIFHRKTNCISEIYEVKSSTWNENKSAKDIEHYIHDASIQYYVLNGLGHSVGDVYITLLNTDYVRDANLNLNQLFTHVRVTEEVLSLQSDIPNKLSKLRNVLKDTEEEPNIDIGWHCKHPNDCDAMNYCWKHQNGIPEYSVFDIFQLNKNNAKSVQLFKEGVCAIEDIPIGFDLTKNQQIKVDVWRQQAPVINKDAIKSFLSTIKYPICHFDFETLNPAIPQFPGMKSYEHYPFQYSLHVEHENGKLEHKEFLAEPGEDPRETIARRITEDIPLNSCVLAYSAGFEKGVIKKLADQFPVYCDHLMNLRDNFIDLATPFKNNDCCYPEMRGGFGLKVVLPTLVPEMIDAYADLDGVHEGTGAQRAFEQLSNLSDTEEIFRVREALLSYCELDTYAMVRLLERLREFAE